ncbi:MAG: hypothetical protein DMG52_23530 [Acidobacteria bacterium]|nr:MAG: hypothetical protein DMG52_23530 [Acidobacteriota bacterium]
MDNRVYRYRDQLQRRAGCYSSQSRWYCESLAAHQSCRVGQQSRWIRGSSSCGFGTRDGAACLSPAPQEATFLRVINGCTFGLGASRKVRLLEINWPSGIVQQINSMDANQIITIREPNR